MHNIELKTVQSSEMTHAARTDETDVTREGETLNRRKKIYRL
jgi:hypothetical protein